MNKNSLSIINSENNPDQWRKEDIIKTIKIITDFHQKANISDFENVQLFEPWKSEKLYHKLLSIIINERVDSKDIPQLQIILTELNHLQKEASGIQVEKTIIHNDFNPRNIMIKKDGTPLIYDWELAVIDFPHRDIVEFLSFVLPDNFEEDLFIFYLKQHFQLYDNVVWEEWLKAYQYSLKVFIVSRVSLYEVTSILVEYKFYKRILKTALRMLDMINKMLKMSMLCQNV